MYLRRRSCLGELLIHKVPRERKGAEGCKMARLVTVEPVLFAFMFCTFLLFPLQEQLIYKKICDSNFNQTECSNLNVNKKAEAFVQKRTSSWMLYINMATTFPSMFAAMILGPCSDKIGRKYILMMPLIGGIIESAALILNSYYHQWDVSALLVGVTIAGFFGNYATILMGVFSYISDISVERSRTLRVSLLESMIFLGGAMGELIGGVLVDNAGFYVTFALACVVHALNLLYVAFLLQESRKPAEKLNITAAFNLKNISNSIGLFVKRRPNRIREKLVILMIGFFAALMVFLGSNTVKVLFVLHHPLAFSSSMIGYFLATSLIYRGIGVVGGMPVFIHVMKLKDYTMIILSCVTTLVMFVALAFATKTWMVFVVPLLDIFGGVAAPCFRSIFSKAVGKEEQGALFSAIAAMEVFCAVIASVLFNNVYAATVEWHPGFCFFIMSSILLIPIFLSMFLMMRDAQLKYSEFTSDVESEDRRETQSGPVNYGEGCT